MANGLRRRQLGDDHGVDVGGDLLAYGGGIEPVKGRPHQEHLDVHLAGWTLGVTALQPAELVVRRRGGP